MKYSIVIPVYNSENSINQLFHGICRYFEERKEDYEIIFVDDCSKDTSRKILEKLLFYPFVICIFLDENIGQQKALSLGLQWASGEYAVTIDDDLQHDIQDLDQFVVFIDQRMELIFGIYEEYKGNIIRKMGSKLVGGFFRQNYPQMKEKRVSSYRVIHRNVYTKLPKKMKKFVYLSAELLNCAENVENVIVKRRNRIYGKSGYHLFSLMKIAWNLRYYYGQCKWNILSTNRERENDHEIHFNVRRGGMSGTRNSEN